jgi:hypothetical protein
MEWTPLNEETLAAMIADAVILMEPHASCLWDLMRIPPAKWALSPWGDLGGGFWVVGIIAMRVVWFNDIEDGFNVSRYTTPGLIDEYWCNQSELQHTIHSLLRQIETGVTFGKSGPPEALA